MTEQTEFTTEIVNDFLTAHRSLKQMPLNNENDWLLKKDRQEYCRSLANEIKNTSFLFVTQDVKIAIEIAHTFYK